jgi:branched-chain amino acid transport system substrate-binding protein
MRAVAATRVLVACTIAVAATLATTACGGDQGSEPDLRPARPVETTGCSPVHYGGEGRPDLLIAGSTVLQGQYVDHGVQIAQALKLVLAQRDWKAGDYRVGLQLCDETTAKSDEADPGKCRSNARAFARNRSVIAVAGPWSSSCAVEMLPILNRAPGGPLVAVSGSSTYLGLTRAGPGVGRAEPGRYSPSGKRGFVRVIPADDAQGAAGALFAESQGAQTAFVLHDDLTFGVGLAEAFRVAAEESGVRVIGTARWDAKARNYRVLAARIRSDRPDAVYLSGYVSSNGARLIEDLREALGPETEIIGPDGFATPGLIVESAGADAEDFAWTIATLPTDELPPEGQELAAEFERRFSSRPCCFAVQYAQSASVILDAITDSDASRAQVNENLFESSVQNGHLGDFEIDRYGDTTLNTIAVYRIEDGRLRFQTAITPPAELLARR